MLNHYPTRTTTYSNNDQGLLTSVDGPLDGDQDTTRFAYDEKGNQTHVINALGHEQVTKAFDESGRPLVVEDANDVQTTLAYNTRGWLAHKTTQTPQGDATTIFTYANSGDYLGQGQIAKIISPDGSEIFYEYDTAYRLIAIHNGEGERIDYTLDLEGNRIAEKTLDATGHLVRQQQYIYDELSRLLASVGADQQTTRFEYDKNGNRAAIIDGRNHKTVFAFDVLNRLVTTTDAADGVIKQTYTSQGQVTSITDQRALTTEYRYNGFGEKIAQISPDTGETTFAYNKAGKLIAKTDARGEVTTYQYDLLGRMLHTHYPSNHAEDIHYRYDQIKADDDFAVGRLSQVLDASGETTYFYNQTGRLDRSQYRLGDTEYGMEYRYNLAGQLMAVRYPSGRWVNYERDSQQRIAAITTDAGQTTVASQMSYLPFGPIKSMLFGNGLSLDIMRDQDYRISAIEVTGSANDAIFDLGYQYDEASNIVEMDDYRQRINSQYFEYDALNRLTSATGSYGNMAYHYDGVSNRLGREQRSANGEQALLEQYQYADDSNRLLSVNQQQGKTHNDRIFAYDAVGNMLRDDRNNQGQRELVYNASNRLAGVAITEKASTRYIYNAKGQRVIRQVTTLDGAVAETHFHYDQADQLVAETDSNGKVIKEYIYHAKQQIAVVDYDSNTQGEWVYLHNDHLGTPKLATNSDQAIVWQADALPFGARKETVGEMNQPLRFPGQTLDEVTGYYYNYFRDYDPSLGRYIQSDPIGLAGGVNTFGYVLGNPFGIVDPNGLQPQWSNMDALQHYRNNGPNVTLSQIGHLSTVLSSSVTQGVISRFGNQINAQAYSLGSAKGAGNYSLNVTFNNSYDFTSDKFFIGGAMLSGDFTGTLTVDANGAYSYSGHATINFSDTFTDPYDTFDWVPGEWNPDGTPYDINDQWVEPYSGGGICP